MLGCPPHILSGFYTFRNIIQTIQRPNTAAIDQNPSFTNGGSSQRLRILRVKIWKFQIFCGFGTQKPIYSDRMMLRVSQIAQNSFPTEFEIFGSNRQLLLQKI